MTENTEDTSTQFSQHTYDKDPDAEQTKIKLENQQKKIENLELRIDDLVKKIDNMNNILEKLLDKMIQKKIK
jgi:uncharacterized FlaG/YvyC family protein